MQNTFDLIYPLIVLGLWILWTFFSPTRYNHGILVALMLPIVSLLMLLIFMVLGISRIVVYPLFVLVGRRANYNRAVERIKAKLWQ